MFTMPRLNAFDPMVDKITNECNTSEDWGLIMEVCDTVRSMPVVSKDCLNSIARRLNHSDPHVVLFTLTLLDACVKNCGRSFHLEVCSRSFVDGLKKMFGKKTHPKVMDKLKLLLKRWAEEDFKKDPQLSLIPALYNTLRKEGIVFNCPEEGNKSPLRKDSIAAKSMQEEDDLTKAIKLSLKESSSPKSVNSLYPVAPSTSLHQSFEKEPRKVRALYDFEAAEDNELTFIAGEIVLVLDDSDSNWWKGTNHRGEGLFPSNFVTADLTAEPEFLSQEINKTTVENDEIRSVESIESVTINEEIIDRVLRMLHEADPTDEHPDCEDLLALHDHCMAMGPLIDQELEKIDRRHASLTSTSHQLTDALNFYHSLMRDCAPTNTIPNTYPQQIYYGPIYQSTDHNQQIPISNMLPQQYLGNTGHTQGLPVSVPQGQFPAVPNSNVNNMPPVNTVINTAYTINPHNTNNTSY